MAAATGLDLGSINSTIAILDSNGNSKPLTNAEGETCTPSEIFFEGGEDPIVGREAQNQGIIEPAYFVKDFKTKLGSDDVLFTSNSGKNYTATDLAALVIKKLKQDAESILGCEINEAVFTTPANALDPTKQALKDAARIAGIKPIQLLHEPTAAATGYGISNKSNQTFVVFDLGGGTFDVIVVRCKSGEFQVIATKGVDIGGRLYTKKIKDYVLKEFIAESGITPDETKDRRFYLELDSASEQAKLSLSVAQKTRITLSLNGEYVTIELTREKFEGLVADLNEQLIEVCRQALSEASLSWSDLDNVLMVGGGTKPPVIRKIASDAFGKPVSTDVDAIHVVSLGAAIHAGALLANTDGNIVHQGRSIPAPKINVRDCTQHSIGVAVDDVEREAICAVVLPKLSSIPGEFEEIFRLKLPDQTGAVIRVIQGEDGSRVEDCQPIGEILLEGLPPDPKLPLRIKVKYVIDANGMCQAFATDKISGKQKHIEFDYSKNVNQGAA